ncbi:MAG: hypothetical protein HYU37_17125 [Acidobacteria bacterium]|nr:hypothetical protein [Acidobacteriota bacterium]
MNVRTVAMLVVLATTIATAQQGRVPLRVLEQRDLSVQGREAVTAIITIR